MNELLGRVQHQMPTGGTIRAGIKVLTKACASNPEMVKRYNDGVNAGATFTHIGNILKKEFKVDYPLIPKNVPYFSVFKKDFNISSNADDIMRLYAEEGEEGFHLYRFPVVFPVDSLDSVMPHGLKCYNRNELRYWSEYTDIGNRICMQREQPKKGVKTFGGRTLTSRGACDPEKCVEYQKELCKISGSFVFFIPEISGLGAIKLSTTSFYALSNARDALISIAAMRNGKISGVVNGEPIFWITKKLEAVSRIDVKTGNVTKQQQWIIKLEANIDVVEMFAQQENTALLAHDPACSLEAPVDEEGFGGGGE